MKIKRIYEPVFNIHLLLIYDCLAFEAEDYLRNLSGIKTRLEKCTGQTGSYIIEDRKDKQSQQTRYYIYVEKGKLKPEILAHEISHLIFFSLFDAGIKITQDTDEVFSYYLEWWTKKINSILLFKKRNETQRNEKSK